MAVLAPIASVSVATEVIVKPALFRRVRKAKRSSCMCAFPNMESVDRMDRQASTRFPWEHSAATAPGAALRSAAHTAVIVLRTQALEERDGVGKWLHSLHWS